MNGARGSDDDLVAAVLLSAEEHPSTWWITRHGTVLLARPGVVLWVGGGRWGFKFGVGMPPILGPRDIAEIPLSWRDKNRLWRAFRRVAAWQIADRRVKALATVGDAR